MNAIQKRELRELGAHLLVLGMGIYFIWQREQALVHMVILIAVTLFTAGVLGTIHWLLAKPRPDAMHLAGPIFMLVVALVVYLLRTQITGIVPMLIGLLALGAGIVQSLNVLKCAGDRLPKWWLHAPTAALWLLFGVLVLTGALNLNSVFMLAVGIFLTVFGILGIAESAAAMHLRR